MKKLIKSFSLILVAICLAFPLAACDDKKEDYFYKDTNNSFTTFLTDMESYETGIKYGNNISIILNTIKSNQSIADKKLDLYLQLENIYDKVFVVSFRYLSQFKDVFLNIPKEIPKNMKSDYKTFEKHLKEAKDALVGLNDDIAYLDNHILKQDITGSKEEILQKAINDIYFDYLKNFKREYIKVSQKFIDLSNEFLELCETYIYPKYETFKVDNKYIELTATQIKNQKTIASLKSAILTLTPTISYLNSFNGEYKKLDTDNFFTTLDKYSTLSLVNDASTTIEELDNWLKNYKCYENDLNFFNESLEEVSLYEIGRNYNFDVESYKNANTDKIGYVNKILTFSSLSVTTLYENVKIICE